MLLVPARKEGKMRHRSRSVLLRRCALMNSKHSHLHSRPVRATSVRAISHAQRDAAGIGEPQLTQQRHRSRATA